MKMEQNDESEKAVPTPGALERFKAKLQELSERRNGVFRDILGNIERRKMEEVRRRMETREDGK